MAEVYTKWSVSDSQIYEPQCGDKSEADSDFSKNIGAGFVMDAATKSLTLDSVYPVSWPTLNSPNEPTGTLTEFGIFSGAFTLTTSMEVFMGLRCPFSLTLKRDGVMVVKSFTTILTWPDDNSNGAVNIEMYDTSTLNFSCGVFDWGGHFSTNDSSRLDVSTNEGVNPHGSLTELHGKSVFNLITNNIMAFTTPWKISLIEGSPQLSIMAYSAGGDPLHCTEADAAYPKGIIEFSSATMGTVVIDTISANAFTLNILNKRGTFSLDGKVIDLQGGGQFKVDFNQNMQRNGFTTGAIIITKVG